MNAALTSRSTAGNVSLELPPGHDVAEIKGDLMMPRYQPGTLVVVDRTIRRVDGEELYLVHDGVGEACRIVSAGSRRGLARVYQENSNYSAYEAEVDEIAITGRIAYILKRV